MWTLHLCQDACLRNANHVTLVEGNLLCGFMGFDIGKQSQNGRVIHVLKWREVSEWRRQKTDVCYYKYALDYSNTVVNEKLTRGGGQYPEWNALSFSYWWLFTNQISFDLFSLYWPIRKRRGQPQRAEGGGLDGEGQIACPIRGELAHRRVTRYVTVDNKSLRLHLSARELPNTKAKCPPCSEAALLRVCGYFNKK